MRNNPINIFLNEPTEVLEEVTIVIPTVDHMSHFQDGIYVNGKFLILAPDMETNKAHITNIVTREKNIVVYLRGWVHELEFLTLLYDALEMHDGIETVYLIPTQASIQVFGAVGERQTLIKEPEFAESYVPSNEEEADEYDLMNIAGMIAGDDYEAELAASLEGYFDIDSKGFILSGPECIGNICELPIRYGFPDKFDTRAYIVINDDPMYVPDATFKDVDTITFSGNYTNLKGSIFCNLTSLELGKFGLVKHKTGDKYYHIVDGESPVWVRSVNNRIELSKMATLEGSVIGTLTPTMINTNIGLLFARCAARDKRRIFEFSACVYKDGKSCPITWEDNSDGGVLNVGSCEIDKSNWRYFMEGTL